MTGKEASVGVNGTWFVDETGLAQKLTRSKGPKMLAFRHFQPWLSE